MLRRALRLWRRACSAGGAIFVLHSGQPGRFGDRLAYSRYVSQYINTKGAIAIPHIHEAMASLARERPLALVVDSRARG